MSYTRKETQDPLNGYFSSLVDFVQLSPHLIEAKNEHSFLIWLDKLEQIDRRSLILYLRKNKNKLPKNHLAIIQRKFKGQI